MDNLDVYETGIGGRGEQIRDQSFPARQHISAAALTATPCGDAQRPSTARLGGDSGRKARGLQGPHRQAYGPHRRPDDVARARVACSRSRRGPQAPSASEADARVSARLQKRPPPTTATVFRPTWWVPAGATKDKVEFESAGSGGHLARHGPGGSGLTDGGAEKHPPGGASALAFPTLSAALLVRTGHSHVAGWEQDSLPTAALP